MQHRMDVDSLLKALNRFIPIRHRAVLTRRNTLRLRYMVFPGAGALALSVLAIGVLSPVVSQASLPTAMEIADADPAASRPARDVAAADLSLLQRLHLTQKRLQRSEQDVAAARQDREEAGKLAMIDPAAGGITPRAPETAPAAAPSGKVETVKIGSGDTLSGVLNRAGLSSGEALQVAAEVRKHVDLHSLRPGQVLNIRFDQPIENHSGGGVQFASLKMAVDPLRTVSVTRGDDGGYETNLQQKPVQKRIYALDATVDNSLFEAAAKAGIPLAVITEAIRVYSWNVDFQRDIREGDHIQVMYEQYETPDGQKVKTGNLIYARLTLGNTDVPIYRYEMKDGSVDYFQPNGHSIRKTLMKTPVDGARISSGFGMRFHPILGYSRMHKGIDFAAPIGTPIYAAGDGTVIKAGRATGYGNYVRLRHNSQLSTAYGHMSRIAVRPGEHVHQGEVIGYVGMSGMATGPHLHYEVLVNNAQVNPRGVNLPTGQILEGKEMKLFLSYEHDVNRQFEALHSTHVASAAPAATPQQQLASLR